MKRDKVREDGILHTMYHVRVLKLLKLSRGARSDLKPVIMFKLLLTEIHQIIVPTFARSTRSSIRIISIRAQIRL